MKKRLLSLLVVLALLLTMLPGTAATAAAEEISSGECGDNLTWTFDPDTCLLTIEGTGDMWNFWEYEYDEELDTWFYRDLPWDPSEIRAISLPDGLTSVGSHAFRECAELTSVTFPAGLTRIGYCSFSFCSSLEKVELPDGLTEIDGEAFSYCSALTEVNVPGTVTDMGGGIFYACDNLQTVTLGDGLTEIGQDMFGGCSSLTSVTIPESVSVINGNAFYDCNELTAVELPDGLISIGPWAFCCTALTSLELPAGLAFICAGAFSDCYDLAAVTIPESVTHIGFEAFAFCEGLVSVTLPHSLEELGSNAFGGCKALRQLIFRNRDTSVGSYTRREYYESDDSYEDFDFAGAVRGGWDREEVEHTESLGLPRKTVVYGPHDPAKEDAEMMLQVEVDDPDYRYTTGWRYAENYAKLYNYTFYATNVFSDVKEGKFYEIPVAWAYGKGITSGVDETHFGPKQDCTRAQVVTFLWNAMGQPEPTISTHPFTDVKPGKFYYNAMLWAYENGVTSGVDATHFGPSQTCTRGQVVTFLWNAMGQPAPTVTQHSFVDVKPGKFYYNAMLWALEYGVTAGIDETHFAPGQTCTRGQVVTFLYNTLNGKAIHNMGDYQRLDEEAVYEANLGSFAERMQEARNEKSNDARCMRYAQAEAELLDSAVMIPTTTRGGGYAISRVAPHTTAFVQWGNDSDRLHGLVVSEDLLTAAERAELETQWEQAVAGSGVYDPAAWLTAKGHTLRRTYTAMFSGTPYTLDWMDTSSSSDTLLLVNCVDGLVEYDNLGNLRPALAESWEISDDGLTYTFHLRHGVNWFTAGGDVYGALTASDFVAGFRHMLDARGGLEGLVGDGGAEIVGVDEYLYDDGAFEDVGCKTLDAYTLQFTLNKPVPFFMSMLTYTVFLPICEDFFLERGGAFGIQEFDQVRYSGEYSYGKINDLTSQVYCGPFLPQEISDEQMLCVKNPGYYNAEAVTLDSIKWRNYYYDPMEMYQNVLSGTLDGISLSASGGTLEQAKQDGIFEQYAYITDTTSTTYFGALNLDRGTFWLEDDACVSPKTPAQMKDTLTAMNNKNFRKALQHAFDKKAYNAVSQGEELAENNLRNMYTPPRFAKLEKAVTDADGHTFPAGTFYGEMVQYYCDKLGCQVDCRDGVDGWYKPEAAQDYLAAAKTELGSSVSWPVCIDVVYYGASDIQYEQAEAYKNAIEGTLGAENVKVNLIEAEDANDFYDCGYRAMSGEEGNFDVFYGSGWGPDYGDPGTYLNTFDRSVDGYMLKTCGLF